MIKIRQPVCKKSFGYCKNVYCLHLRLYTLSFGIEMFVLMYGCFCLFLQKVAVPEGCDYVPLTKKPAKPAKVLEFSSLKRWIIWSRTSAIFSSCLDFV